MQPQTRTSSMHPLMMLSISYLTFAIRLVVYIVVQLTMHMQYHGFNPCVTVTVNIGVARGTSGSVLIVTVFLG